LVDEVKKTRVGGLDTEIEDIAQKILLELETATTTDLTDAKYAKMILRLSDASYTRLGKGRSLRFYCFLHGCRDYTLSSGVLLWGR
jgi:hypothetical protein